MNRKEFLEVWAALFLLGAGPLKAVEVPTVVVPPRIYVPKGNWNLSSLTARGGSKNRQAVGNFSLNRANGGVIFQANLSLFGGVVFFDSIMSDMFDPIILVGGDYIEPSHKDLFVVGYLSNRETKETIMIRSV